MSNGQSKRLLSLDVFRGMTIAGMVLVNNPGSSPVYSQLDHAEWHGWTPTDFIFPFFVFIIGVSITIALGKRVEQGKIDASVYWKIFKRTLIIFGLGLFIAAFPFFDFLKVETPLYAKVIAILSVIASLVFCYFEKYRLALLCLIPLCLIPCIIYLNQVGFPYARFEKLRIMGVLQRLALCYFFTSIIFLHTNWKQQVYIFWILLLSYWAVMLYGGDGDLTKEGNFAGYVDRLILTENHIWQASKIFDPEGLLSTIPAISSCLAGVLCGTWLKTNRSDLEKTNGMFFFGLVLLSIGWVWNFWFPINKSLWTSSYVVFMAGQALLFLAACYWLIDIKGYKKWTKPFEIFGVNALALFVGSAILARIMIYIFRWTGEDGKTVHSQQWVYKTFFEPLASPINASLIYAICYIGLWLFLMWLLYRKKIYIKV